jgi:hypothetical protein
MKVREASFALRVVRRNAGDAAIVYRRRLTNGKEKLDRVGSLSPLVYAAGTPLLRNAINASSSSSVRLSSGPFLPLDADWGARVACYALVAAGLRNAQRLQKAATHLQHADGAEAAWWLGVMSAANGKRAVRALRILTEAVK